MWFKKKTRTLSSISDKALSRIGSKLAGLFYKHGGPNYLSLTFIEDGTEQQFEILIRKYEGKTPAQRVIELEETLKLHEKHH